MWIDPLIDRENAGQSTVVYASYMYEHTLHGIKLSNANLCTCASADI